MPCIVTRVASLMPILYAVSLHAEYAEYAHPFMLSAPGAEEDLGHLAGQWLL